MTGPLGNSEFCFPRISMFPSTSSRETLRFSGKQKFTVSPRGPVIKCFIAFPLVFLSYLPTQKQRKKYIHFFYLPDDIFIYGEYS